MLDIRAYVHSQELDKLLELTEKSADVGGVLLYNIGQALLDNQKVPVVLVFAALMPHEVDIGIS